MNKNELNIIEIINMMLRRWWLILVMMLVGGIIAFMYTDFFVVPIYKTDGALYINCATESTELEDTASAGKLNSSSRLAATCVEILQRRTFLEGVSADIGDKYTYKQLQNMLSIVSVNETELLEISVTGPDPKQIQRVLESVLTRAPQELVRVVKAGSVEIVDRPSEPKTPISPDIMMNTIIGVVIGLVLGIAAILWMEIFDTRIKTPDQIKSSYDEPLLGEIPSLEDEN